MEERLQKLLSAAGLCSRRQAEEYLRAGRVAVNGAAAGLGDRADPDRDLVTLDGVPLPQRRERQYLMLHKPRGYVTTLSDERGRPTVAQLVADCGERVYPVGRLDMDSEALMLLTSDGNFAQRQTHPSQGQENEAHVTDSGALSGCETRLEALRELEDGSPIAPASVRVLERRVGEWVIAVTIHQGLNRQIRRMCALAGLTVRRLRRVREGVVCLGDLPVGKWRRLTGEELAALEG